MTFIDDSAYFIVKYCILHWYFDCILSVGVALTCICRLQNLVWNGIFHIYLHDGMEDYSIFDNLWNTDVSWIILNFSSISMTASLAHRRKSKWDQGHTAIMEDVRRVCEVCMEKLVKLLWLYNQIEQNMIKHTSTSKMELYMILVTKTI